MVKRMAPTLPNAASSALRRRRHHRRVGVTALRGKALTIRVGACPTAAHTRCEASGTSRRCCADGQRARGLTPMARASRSGRSPSPAASSCGRRSTSTRSTSASSGTACRRCRPSRSSSTRSATSSATGRSRPPTANDFARWVALELGDRALTERLAVVDPFAFPDVNALREHLVTIVQDHLRGPRRIAARRVRPAFHFQRSYLVEVPLELTATDLTEFPGRAGERRRERDLSAHRRDAGAVRSQHRRLRGVLRTSLDLSALAERFDHLDPYLTTLERVRGRLLGLLDEALESERT